MENDSSSKTVYFLGAGFSKAIADLPTINEFLKIKDFDKDTLLRKFIEIFFKDSKFTIEDILTYIDLGLSDLGEKIGTPLRLLEGTKEELNFYLEKRLIIDFQNKRKENKDFNIKYESYVGRLRKIFENVSAILTLNYDCIVEGILEPTIDIKILNTIKLLSSSTQRFSDEEFIREFSEDIIIKLHGSLDWLSCFNPNCLYPSVTKEEVASQRLMQYLGTTVECKRCGMSLSRLVIPPSFCKSLDKFNSFIFRIWSLAKEILNKADKIVIIGVSFAPSDYYLRWLFKSAIAPRQNKQKPKIEVVNKTEEKEKICSIVKEITGVESEFKGDFDEYLKKIKLGGV